MFLHNHKRFSAHRPRLQARINFSKLFKKCMFRHRDIEAFRQGRRRPRMVNHIFTSLFSRRVYD